MDEHVPALLETMRDAEVLRFTRSPDPSTETLLEMTRWAFDEGMQRVTALISVENRASSAWRRRRFVEALHPLECWSILPGELSARTPSRHRL